MVRLSALLKGAFALILKIAILLFWGTSAPKHKHFSAGKLHFVRLSALLKGAFALILKIAILLFWGTSAPKHKHFSAGKLHFVRLFEQARKGW